MEEGAPDEETQVGQLTANRQIAIESDNSDRARTIKLMPSSSCSPLPVKFRKMPSALVHSPLDVTERASASFLERVVEGSNERAVLAEARSPTDRCRRWRCSLGTIGARDG